METTQEKVKNMKGHTIRKEKDLIETKETLEMDNSKADTAAYVDPKHTQQI